MAKRKKVVKYKTRNGFQVFVSPNDKDYRVFVTQKNVERSGVPKCPLTGKNMVLKKGYK